MLAKRQQCAIMPLFRAYEPYSLYDMSVDFTVDSVSPLDVQRRHNEQRLLPLHPDPLPCFLTGFALTSTTSRGAFVPRCQRRSTPATTTLNNKSRSLSPPQRFPAGPRSVRPPAGSCPPKTRPAFHGSGISGNVALYSRPPAGVSRIVNHSIIDGSATDD